MPMFSRPHVLPRRPDASDRYVDRLTRLHWSVGLIAANACLLGSLIAVATMGNISAKILIIALGALWTNVLFSCWAYAIKVQRDARRLRAEATDVDSLLRLPYTDFERLVADAYRAQGYSVTSFADDNGPDGGADLEIRRDGRRLLVQCKRWRKWVDVTVVRELAGVVAAARADGGVVIASWQCAPTARAFAVRAGIELIEGTGLIDLLHPVRKPVTDHAEPTPPTRTTESPRCPVCGGPTSWKSAYCFWSCCTYPECRGKVSQRNAGAEARRAG
jgi:restriction system protein